MAHQSERVTWSPGSVAERGRPQQVRHDTSPTLEVDERGAVRQWLLVRHRAQGVC